MEPIRGVIKKFLPVCNNFDKALVELEGGQGNVFSMAPKVQGVQVFDKGETVAWTPGPLYSYKGHEVRGTLAMIQKIDDPQAFKDADDWGLT
jgi:hypothetical protein